LTHLVPPEQTKIVVKQCACLAPEFQAALCARCSVLDLEQCGSERCPIAGRNGVANKIEPVVK
jgi:hypothetical protein